MLRLDIERMLLIPMKMKDQTMIYLVYGTAARRTWRPFTRIGRAKRVGLHVLQATMLPYRKSLPYRRSPNSTVAASCNAMLLKKSFRAQLRGVSDICISCAGYQRYMPKHILLDLILLHSTFLLLLLLILLSL